MDEDEDEDGYESEELTTADTSILVCFTCCAILTYLLIID